MSHRSDDSVTLSPEQTATLHRELRRYLCLSRMLAHEQREEVHQQLKAMRSACFEWKLWPVLRGPFRVLAKQLYYRTDDLRATGDGSLEHLAQSIIRPVVIALPTLQIDWSNNVLHYLLQTARYARYKEWDEARRHGLKAVDTQTAIAAAYGHLDDVVEVPDPHDVDSVAELMRIPALWQEVVHFWERTYTDERYRQIIHLRYLGQQRMTLQQIATALNINVNTIKKYHAEIFTQTTEFVHGTSA